MRLRVEFTTEPFDLDEAPTHAVVAREVIQGAELDAVDVGPFGNTAEGARTRCSPPWTPCCGGPWPRAPPGSRSR